MPIRWYGPANPEDPTYRHFERIVNLCLHGGVFAAVNSGGWFLQEMRHPFPEGKPDLGHQPLGNSVAGPIDLGDSSAPQAGGIKPAWMQSPPRSFRADVPLRQ